MDSQENTIEKKLLQYKETEAQIEELKTLKVSLLEEIEEARKSEPIYALRYFPMNDNPPPGKYTCRQEVGLFTSKEKAIHYEETKRESLDKHLREYEYEVVEYPPRCTIGDSDMSRINRTPE